MKKGSFSKGVVILVLLCNLLFVMAVLGVFLHTGAEPITLTGCWFGFTTAELWSLAGIKKNKNKEEQP